MSNVWDETKIRRGQPTNRGQFATKHNSAPGTSLADDWGFGDDYEDPFGTPDVMFEDDFDDFDEPAPAPAPQPEPDDGRYTGPIISSRHIDISGGTPIVTTTRETIYYGNTDDPTAPTLVVDQTPYDENLIPKRKPKQAPTVADRDDVPPVGEGIGRQEAKRLALIEMEKHGLTQAGWTFDFHDDESGSVMGRCNYRTKTITLGRNHSDHSPRDVALDTINHEIAHALVGPGKGHGKTWQWKALTLGANPSASKENPYTTHKGREIVARSYSLPADAPEPERYKEGMRVTINIPGSRGREYAGKVFVVEKHPRKNIQVIYTEKTGSRGATKASVDPSFIKAHREGDPLPEVFNQ